MRDTGRLARPLLGALLVLAPFAAAPARALEGAPSPPLMGIVQDSLGSPLPNVQVIVTEVSRVTTTDMSGRFVLRGLPAGTYHLNSILIGYRPGHTVVVLPDSGADVRVTITMVQAIVRLQSVQVTATPTGTDPLNITQATVELSGNELTRNLGASVAQTLSSEPGMAMRFNGPAANTPVIRGLTGERIVVLQDGERAGDLSSTSSDHGLSVDPLDAQRIEVVRGPASLLYGNSALGGVVNVISNDIPTTVPTHVEGYVSGQAESVNPGGAASASLTVPAGEHFVLSARGGVRRISDVRAGGEGVLTNTDSRNTRAVAGLGYVGERFTAGLVYRGMDFQYGLPAPADAEESGVRIDGRRHEASARAALDLRNRHVSYLRLEGSSQWYNHDEIESSGEIGTRFKLRTQTAGATARTQFSRVAGAVGVQGLFRQYSPTGEEALTPPAENASGGVFVYQEVALTGRSLAEIQTPRVQFGARYDQFSIRTKPDGDAEPDERLRRTFHNVSGSVGLNLPFGESYSFSVSAARAFRAPTVEELLSNGFHAATGSFEVGDAGLGVETNQGLDAVLRARSGETFAQLSSYYNRINDYIYPQFSGTQTIEGEQPGETVDVPRFVYGQRDAHLRGVEGQVETELVRHVVVGAVGDVTRGDFVSSGGPLPFMPAARLGGSARWDNGRLSLGAEYRHAFAQSRVSRGASAGAVVDVPNP
ncbi:MAG TPA: TonB-dependent receptor, partial [Gemmatimonadaceae bacterium]|nr:TonB-dependent receptor [Gemmatimonadaceae bacterium]